MLNDEAVSACVVTEWSYGAQLTSTSQMPALKVMIGTIDMAVVVDISRSGKGWGDEEYLARFKDGERRPRVVQLLRSLFPNWENSFEAQG